MSTERIEQGKELFRDAGDPDTPFRSKRMEKDTTHFKFLHAELLVDYPEIDPRPDINHDFPADWKSRLNEFGLKDETESPIELHMQRAMFLGRALIREGNPPAILKAGCPPFRGFDRVQIIPQFKVAMYRADFAVCYWQHGTFSRVLVECDGHEFHAVNASQVEYDKQRDRKLMQQGWPVMRFTGSEIAGDALGCAYEVGRALSGLQWDTVTAYRAGLAALHRKQMGLSDE